jgi:hypothetical protein
MELAPRYCRTCGSRILVKHICHNCNNDPLKGDNYCYDCGALTPTADSCLKCGAKYKQNFPAKPLITGILIIIAIVVAGYFLLQPGKISLATENDKTVSQTHTPTGTNDESQILQDTIANNPVDTSMISVKQTDSIVNTPLDSAKKDIAGIFTSSELKIYNSRCSYFHRGMRNRVLFLISGGSGYIKMNDKTHVLKRKRKGVDVAVFAGDGFEATITIDGLSGSAKEWLASCTLVIKNVTQNTSVKHKVYSSCIEL